MRDYKKTKKEFTRFATNYQDISDIQKQVAKYLISKVAKNNKTILDIGCGSGNIYNHITWDLDFFYGIDFSQKMCDLHNKANNIQIKQYNFDDIKVYDYYKNKNIDIILSSSALQWSNNLDNVLKSLRCISDKIAFSIFTDMTFKKLLDRLNVKSFLSDKQSIKKQLEKYFNVKIQIKNYKKKFDSTKDLIRFIKTSGISGGIKRASVSSIKALIYENDIKELEWEVLFIYTGS